MADYSPTDLRKYLESQGWVVLEAGIKDRLYVFEHADFPRRQLAYPMDMTAPDYEESVGGALLKLAEITGREIESVIAEATLARKATVDKFLVHPDHIVWAKYDLYLMCESFARVIESHYNNNAPFQDPINTDAQMALRILRGFIPYMESLKKQALQTKGQA
jgi:hypothetical protein